MIRSLTCKEKYQERNSDAQTGQTLYGNCLCKDIQLYTKAHKLVSHVGETKGLMLGEGVSVAIHNAQWIPVEQKWEDRTD
jgi:hypothetical protein